MHNGEHDYLLGSRVGVDVHGHEGLQEPHVLSQVREYPQLIKRGKFS